jgi:riboflavin synthase
MTLLLRRICAILGLESLKSMFTGLIEATGTVLSVEERPGSRRIAIAAPGIKLREGDSIAVSGVCLTAVNFDSQAGRFAADLAAETVARTSLASLAPGSTVNLELPTPAGAPLGGHIVQGHVDATGTLLRLAPVNPEADRALTDWRLRVLVPAGLGRYMVEKGSIAVEGISLTIARWEPHAAEGAVVEIAIIPHTYAHTNLSTLEPGRLVNLEADVMLKFAEQRRSEEEFELTTAFLIANGY